MRDLSEIRDELVPEQHDRISRIDYSKISAILIPRQLGVSP